MLLQQARITGHGLFLPSDSEVFRIMTKPELRATNTCEYGEVMLAAPGNTHKLLSYYLNIFL